MEITRPTLLLNEAICRKNIHQLAEKARLSNVVLRPHFKTHQSHEVGRWFREAGIDRCTVSSIRMASYFADDGWKDITVAFPLNALEAAEINRLAALVKLNLCVVNPDGLRQLLKRLEHPVNCLIEIDTGNGRSGITPHNHAAIDEILAVISSSKLLSFGGFLTHAGHSYASRSVAEIQAVHDATLALMREAGDHYRGKYPGLILSVGDTPTCSKAKNFIGVDEMRPGNFVFYDVWQCLIGACDLGQVAIAMACPVVAMYPDRQEFIVHGGGVHFSKDSLKQPDGSVIFGQAVRLTKNGWELPPLPVYVKSLSQEHGVLHAPKDFFSTIKVGDVLGILPIHSCLTADAMGEYVTLEGKRISMMPKTK